MAAITAKKRQSLKSSQFALPGKGEGPGGKGAGSYPIDTPARARNALARGAQNASPAELATIKRKVAAKYPSIDVSGAKKKKPTHGSGKLTAMGQKTLQSLQAKHGDAEGRKRFHSAMNSGQLSRSRMMTQAEDEAADKKAGIKPGSARDNALDKKRGVKV